MATGEQVVRLAAMGDVHCTKTSQGALQPLFQQMNERADILLLCGDLTDYGLPVQLCPVEETIWSKAFVMERERYDGADIAHLLHAYGERLDWHRLLNRFDSHWRILLSPLVLFGFIYPDERGCIPAFVMETLLDRRRSEAQPPLTAGRLCQGTLLSRAQYPIDLECWGYEDARLPLKERAGL
jgi:hypothetical protein